MTEDKYALIDSLNKKKKQLKDFDDYTISVIKDSSDVWLNLMVASDVSYFFILVFDYYVFHEENDEANLFINSMFPKYDAVCKWEYNNKSYIFHEWALLLLRLGKREEAWEKIKKSFYYMFCDNISWDGYEFFSFRTFNSDFPLMEIKNSTLTLSHPQQFNDPLDTLFFQWLDKYQDKAKSDVEKELAILLHKAADFIKVRCFARSIAIPEHGMPTEKQLQGKLQNIEDISSLMWAHYADSHKGFCIKYRFSNDLMINDFKRQRVLRMGNIKYRKTFQLTSKINLADALYVKAHEWFYEKESRLISYNPNDDLEDDFEDLSINTNSIQAIYLGVRCSLENENKMRRLLHDKTIPLYRMRFNARNIFKLDPVRIG